MGAAYKVVEVDRTSKEDLGTYVAKVAHDGGLGQRILRAYSLACSHLGRNAGLSTIFEVARQWQENAPVALMTWVEGSPLAEFIGLLPLLAEDLEDASAESLASRWLRGVCASLEVLHRNGLVHGDVSPRNMIVSGDEIVLTDYDFVTRVGEPVSSPGTVLYCPPSDEGVRNATRSDDIYALAASYFHVLFDREPFRYGGHLDKGRGLNWEGIARSEYVRLAEFLDRATHPTRSSDSPAWRMPSCALSWELERARTSRTQRMSPPGVSTPPTQSSLQTLELREERIDWLRSLLQSYPWLPLGEQGNARARFSVCHSTYVETPLEEALLGEIMTHKVRLVVLCGNAGDGKTALLQHVAQRLGLGRHQSADRILKGKIAGGPAVRMNLDGSASWKGRSADELLDEFLEPFRDGPPSDDVVHLLAINDGRLLEWVEGYADRHDGRDTALTKAFSVSARRGSGNCGPAHPVHQSEREVSRRERVGGRDYDEVPRRAPRPPLPRW